MAKIQLLVGILLTFMFSCSKKNGQDTSPQSDVCHLLTETLNDKPFRNYEYTENKQLYRIVQYGFNAVQKRYTFEYDNKDRVKVFRETYLMAPFNNYQYTIFYSGDSKIDSIQQFKITNSGSVLQETHFVEYDTQNRINKYTWGKKNYWRYEYDNEGNVTKWLVKLANASQELTLAEYSNFDKMQSMFSISQPSRLVSLINGEYRISQNPGSFKLYESGGTVSQTGVITYLYNVSSYPTEASLSVFYDGGGTYTDVYKYTYECL